MLIDLIIINMVMYFVQRDHLQEKFLIDFFQKIIFGVTKKFYLNSNLKNCSAFLVKVLNVLSSN